MNAATKCRARNRRKTSVHLQKLRVNKKKRCLKRGNEFKVDACRRLHETRSCRYEESQPKEKEKKGWRRERTNKAVTGVNEWEKKSIHAQELEWSSRQTCHGNCGQQAVRWWAEFWSIIPAVTGLPAGSSRVRYTESREQWFWLQTNSTWLPAVVVRTEGGEGVKRGWFRHVTKRRRATCTRLSHGGWIWAMRFSIERC